MFCYSTVSKNASVFVCIRVLNGTKTHYTITRLKSNTSKTNRSR